MKRILSLILILVFLAGCSVTDRPQPSAPVNSEICAVWIFYSELSMQDVGGGTEAQFRERTEEMFDNCAKLGINTVFYHVRPYCDAFYKSDIFPWSAYLTGTQGKAVDYDPLEIACEIAHEKGLTLHAWLNPFRISHSNDISALSESNPALEWIKSKSPNVITLDNGIYFSPASPEAQKMIVDGVREIVENYDVDGIHIDDYFYPSTDESVDSFFYDEYKKSGGELKLSEWRLNTVSAFVSSMYAATKSVSGDCVFSISPAGNIKNNYEEQFADVKLWLKKRGYADWIIPQVYYGYENNILPFDNACDAWANLHSLSDIRMIYGIAAYKVSDSDEEWQAGSGIIAKQLDYIRTKPNCSGAAFFSYSSLIDEKKASEFECIKDKVLSETLTQPV